MVMMKIPSMLILALLAAPIATAGRRNTSAWNTPSRGRFGIRRTNNINTSGSYIVEQALSASSSSSCADEVVDMNMILQLQDEESSSQMIEESMMMQTPNSRRQIVTDGVRAAAVACVSAAAIGGARHALEMIL